MMQGSDDRLATRVATVSAYALQAHQAARGLPVSTIKMPSNREYVPAESFQSPLHAPSGPPFFKASK